MYIFLWQIAVFVSILEFSAAGIVEFATFNQTKIKNVDNFQLIAFNINLFYIASTQSAKSVTVYLTTIRQKICSTNFRFIFALKYQFNAN